jgi:hypothetical protein
MDEISVEIHLGAVKTVRGSKMAFSLRLNSAGVGSLWIYASDSDGRRSGTLFVMNESEYEELKTIVVPRFQTRQ